MTRPLRIEFEDALYHVTSRGNDGNIIFHGDPDKELFLSVFRSIKKRYNLIIHSYCLMDDHYHLLVETPWANLSQSMKQISGIYTQKFNGINERSGHLFCPPDGRRSSSPGSG
jgi:putative transposase